jgi:hypothetical protein
VFISLVRVGLMQTYRANAPGNQPYNRALCTLFHHPRGGKAPNPALQAYCHAVVTNNDLWIAAICWGVAFFVFGIIFFWRAENKYGRG